MVSNTAKEVFIQGITRDGKTFRPSDWADRLCGVMSQFRPGGPQPGSHLTFSPWCVPTVINGVKCVVVNAAIRDAEPMAWDFAINFAKDNDLVMAEACLIADALQTCCGDRGRPVLSVNVTPTKKPSFDGFFDFTCSAPYNTAEGSFKGAFRAVLPDGSGCLGGGECQGFHLG